MFNPHVFLFVLDSSPVDFAGSGQSLRDIVVDIHSHSINSANDLSTRPATFLARIDLNTHSSEAFSVVSDEEIQHAMRNYRDTDRQTCIYAHALLRLVLSLRIGVSPSELAFLRGRFGKLALCEPNQHLHFNISYRNSAIALAIGNMPLGVDIENTRDDVDFEGIGARFFTAEELAYLRNAPPEDIKTRFFFLWTRKEALVKASGIGMTAFPVANGLRRKVALSNEMGTVHSYRTYRLEPPPGFAAALSIQSK